MRLFANPGFSDNKDNRLIWNVPVSKRNPYANDREKKIQIKCPLPRVVGGMAFIECLLPIQHYEGTGMT